MDTKVKVILKKFKNFLVSNHESSRVWRHHASLNRETPGKESFSGQFYPEQSVFHGPIADPVGSSDVNATRSKWMIANSGFLNITFQSDEVFNNFGTSLTLKCSNLSHLNDTQGKNNISCLDSTV